VGFRPGAAVTLRYTGTLVSSTASATADRRGRFAAQLQANGTLPGSYTVSAADGSQTASASFRQTT
jgi:hypothetical protein